MDSLVALELPALASAGGSSYSVQVQSSGAVETVDLSALTIATGDLRLYVGLSSLGRVDLNSFCTRTNPGNVQIATVAGGAGVRQGINCASSSADDFERGPEL